MVVFVISWICFVDLLFYCCYYRFSMCTCVWIRPFHFALCSEWIFCWSSSMHCSMWLLLFIWLHSLCQRAVYSSVSVVWCSFFWRLSVRLPFLTVRDGINFLNMILFSYWSSNGIICMHFISIIHFASCRFVSLQSGCCGRSVFSLRLKKIRNANAKYHRCHQPSTCNNKRYNLILDNLFVCNGVFL